MEPFWDKMKPGTLYHTIATLNTLIATVNALICSQHPSLNSKGLNGTEIIRGVVSYYCNKEYTHFPNIHLQTQRV